MNRYLILLIIIALLFPSAVLADRFYDGKAEGWFFHKEKQEEIKEEEEPEAVKPPEPEKVEEPEIAETPEQKPEEIFLSAAWIRENLPIYRDKAIDNPTRENIAAYAYLQKVMIDKADRFKEGMTMVVDSDPLLDENTRRPQATAGARAANIESDAAIDSVMKQLSKDAGIWFFYSSTCQYCELMAPILDWLQKKYGLKTFAISMDGKPLPSGLFPNYAINQGQASIMSVEQTPAMYLVKPGTSEIYPLGQSVISMPDLVKRIIMAAKEMGYISVDDFESTRRMKMDNMFDQVTVPSEATSNPIDFSESLKSQLK